MQTRIDQVYAGCVQPMPNDGRPTGIFKTPVDGPVQVGEHGIVIDAQADRRVHGGPEKAVHHFPAKNYARLRAAFPQVATQLVPGSLGENISTSDWDESEVCIGDVLRAGSVRLQLCQPRSPCWKIDARFGVDGMTRFIAEHGLAGWYYRVLQPGAFAAGDALVLEWRAADAVSLREYWDLYAAARPDLDAVRRVVDAPGLAPDKRERWRQRLAWLQANA
ncbi:MOSC domain-containing protein [Sinimarinibacterium thermocellulolyticum]|uniref:MOSC domain-containing protein n=1 Tax=Sinimarinibacterium thermocellulolyticum TaxID=3170016 RepID=A0ABV2A5Z2_9GAMM